AGRTGVPAVRRGFRRRRDPRCNRRPGRPATRDDQCFWLAERRLPTGNCPDAGELASQRHPRRLPCLQRLSRGSVPQAGDDGQRLPADRTLSVHATVTDLSRRSQSADGGALITAGLFRLSLETDKSVYKPGERIAVLIRATDYDGKPVATNVRVRLIETKQDR